MYKYKVVEQRQKSAIRKHRMKSEDFEKMLNEHADGWVLYRIVSGETHSFVTGGKDIYLVIFRKEI